MSREHESTRSLEARPADRRQALGKRSAFVSLARLLPYDLPLHGCQSISTYHPQVIVVETHGFDINRPHENDIYRYLAARNYRLAGFLVLNGDFVLSDRPLLSA